MNAKMKDRYFEEKKRVVEEAREKGIDPAIALKERAEKMKKDNL